MDYGSEASEILQKLGDRKIPVEIYELAEIEKIKVLIRKTEDLEKIGIEYPKAMLAAKAIVKGIWKDSYNFGEEEYFLFLTTKDSLERRLLTAFFVAKKCIKKHLLGNVEFIDSNIETSDDAYKLALYLLMPSDSLDGELRGRDTTAIEAIKDESVITDLSEKFLVSKVDVANRLKLSKEA